ncbi:dimethyl sulfoxide reductase anchor subunit [Enterovibrio sp. ZSDZ35]|uniref:Dimethyl sulfoxide reductase anchor subunit n=1 Tax=Enterovibrio qingdaonensis TaxID=2899818 RepID=A0ABT5QP31_9GAMM|nr:DmsC/YnfH family molybdoenzyme membrane anchor subunit [Enterovibrio sp. ZSDZ35]MDD1782629.1 dimethyl sulfoxide reductase anchor subunit [Enterovibrio sp. ZSDZ35]
MAWHEWPLVVFTVFAQTSVGAFLVLSVLLLSKQFCPGGEQRLHKAMFGLWVIMGLGFMTSTMHLGSPLRAMNALNMVGKSWLSNEIASGSVFFALGGFYWLLSILDKGSEGLRKVLMLGAMSMGAFFMYAMIMVYMIDTVPTWYTGLTPAAFLLTMAVSGLALAHLLLVAANHKVHSADTILPLMGLLSAMGVVIAVAMLTAHLGSIETSATSAMAVVPEIETILLVRLSLLTTGLVMWLLPVFMKQKPALPVMVIAFVLIVLSELVGRGMFYGMHMTAGV